MSQTAIPFLFMRGGTSRGPYFNRADLPDDLDSLSEVLIAAIGSGHPLNIDGIGGGNAVTTKVAMLSRSEDKWADIDYFFAQVSVKDRLVDFKPTCGNILAGVGSAALEMGLMPMQKDQTKVKIRAVNTDAKITALIHTPNKIVSYEGDTVIDGVPGAAAAVFLSFMEVAGSSTGALLPTGNLIDTIKGIEVTCMDVAMPMVIARAQDFGLTGHETREELDANRDFFKLMEQIRCQAAGLMGMGDCSGSVTPKFGLLAPARAGGSIAARYFMPWATHPSMAVTGGQCLASCALTPRTVADGMLSEATLSKEKPKPQKERQQTAPVDIVLEHPMGTMEISVDYKISGGNFIHKASGLKRTCRKLAAGEVFIPRSIWNLDLENRNRNKITR